MFLLLILEKDLLIIFIVVVLVICFDVSKEKIVFLIWFLILFY